MNIEKEAKPGQYVNFVINRVNTGPDGKPMGYRRAKCSGIVEKVHKLTRTTDYTVRNKRSNEYFKVNEHQLTHVWHIVEK